MNISLNLKDFILIEVVMIAVVGFITFSITANVLSLNPSQVKCTRYNII